MSDDHIRVQLDGSDVARARARSKAWELIISSVTAGGTELDAVVFSDFAREMLDKGDRGFMLGVVGELDRIAASAITSWAQDSGRDPRELADVLHERDERESR